MRRRGQLFFLQARLTNSNVKKAERNNVFTSHNEPQFVCLPSSYTNAKIDKRKEQRPYKQIAIELKFQFPKGNKKSAKAHLDGQGKHIEPNPVMNILERLPENLF